MKREKKHIRLVNMAIDDLPTAAKDPTPQEGCAHMESCGLDFGSSCAQKDICRFIDLT